MKQTVTVTTMTTATSERMSVRAIWPLDMLKRMPRSDSEKARPWRTTGDGTLIVFEFVGTKASAARPESASPRFIPPRPVVLTRSRAPALQPRDCSGSAQSALTGSDLFALTVASALISPSKRTEHRIIPKKRFVFSLPFVGPAPNLAKAFGMARAIACAVLAVLCASTAAEIVNKARTQELFHTPYREEDSRHFKVDGDLQGAVPLALKARRARPARPRPFRIQLVWLLRWPSAASCRSISDFGVLSQIEDSATFHADAEKRFDLSYADGSELKGFNAHDIVHVRPPPTVPFLFSVFALVAVAARAVRPLPRWGRRRC